MCGEQKNLKEVSQEGNLDRGVTGCRKEQGPLQPYMHLPPGAASCHQYPPHFPATSPTLGMGL